MFLVVELLDRQSRTSSDMEALGRLDEENKYCEDGRSYDP
jgi:hypothetical protein